MADTKTSAEAAASALTGVELIRIVQSGNMRKVLADVLGHQFRGARARRTTNQTTANYTSATAIPFEQADIDTDGFWSAGSPTRLTIPADKGFTHVDVCATVRVDLSTIGTYTKLFLQQYSSGNVQKDQFANYGNSNDTTKFVSAAGVGVPVADGDYFIALLQEQSDTSITVRGDINNTKLVVKIAGMTPI